MAFDPDAWLATKESKDFDPDQWLADKEATTQTPNQTTKEPGWTDTAMAGGEAALSMLAGMPAQIAGGLKGSYRYLQGVGEGIATGSMEPIRRGAAEGGDIVDQTQESNFGLGAFTGLTEKGKEYSEGLGNLMEMPGKKAGEVARKLGLDPIYGELPVNLAMELIEPTAIYGGARALTRPKKLKKPVNEVPVADILKEDTQVQPPAQPTAAPELVGPEKPGPYSELDPNLQMWRDRAGRIQKQAIIANQVQTPEVLREQMRDPNVTQTDPLVGTPEQMEGLSRSTEGVSFENIPPDAVIPRNAPTKGVEVPRKGQWTVDDDGMPIRTGFAPEHVFEPASRAQELDIPARNDLGVALQYEANGPKLGAGDHWGSEPLNKAAAGWGQSPAIDAGPAPSKVMRSPGGRQGGYLNLDIFDPRFDKSKRLDDRYMLRVRGPEYGNVKEGVKRPHPTVFLIDKQAEGGPKVVGSVIWGHDQWAKTPDMDHNLEALFTQVDPAHQGKGLAEKMYRFMNELGNDIVPSEGKQTPDGKAMWEGFRKRGYTGLTEDTMRERGMSGGMGRSQRGGLDIQAIADSLANLRSKWGGSKQLTPEEVSTREQVRAKAKVLTNVIGAKLPEYLDPVSAEEAAVMAQNAKDIKSTAVGNRLASGLNFMAAYHNNPLLKWARRVMSDANAEATAFKNDHQTGPEGFVPLSNKMTTADKLRFNELWSYLSKNNMDYTDEIGTKVGLSPAAKAASEAWQRGSNASWDWAMKNAAIQGIKQAPRRNGYTPSMHDGSYLSVVMDGDRLIGTISADTPGEFFKAKKWYEDNHKGVKFSADTPSQARLKIGGAEATHWKFRDLGQMINLLTKEDNSFSKLQQEFNKSALEEATNFRGFQYHNVAKGKGEGSVIGAMGERPWLSEERNAQDRVNSMNRYLGEAADYHSMQLPMEELNKTMASDAFAHMPVAREYLGTYLKNVKGQYTNDFGQIANAAFDLATQIPGVKNVGSRNILKGSNAVKNTLAQMYMGWYNGAFMVSQLLQPVQTGVPIGFMVARRLGLNELDFADSMARGYGNFIRYDLDRVGLMKMDPEMKYVTQWMRDRGILKFTEMEEAFTGEKGKLARTKDTIANQSMQVGEHASRVPMFMAFYDLVKKAEPNKEVALQVAEHLTNQAMANYSRAERPLMYSGMGVMGPHTGALTTFKHNYIGTQALLAKEIKKTGNFTPAVASAMMAIGLAGLTGVAAYDEMDSIYQFLRGKISGEKRSIRQDFMQMLPEMLKTGVLSDVIGLNMQGKFSSAQMVAGGDVGQMVAPYAAGAWDIARDVGTAAMDPSRTNLANAAVTLSPASTRQAVKAAVQRDADGNLLDRKGKVDVHRTPEEWKKAAITGLTPLGEAVQRQNLFQNRKNEKFRQEQLKDAATKFEEGLLADDDAKQADALNQYEEAGGNVANLLKRMGIIQREAGMTSQERAEGTPRSMGGAARYEEFQTKP